MESTEFYAKLLFHARMLGGEKEIPCGQVKKLIDLRKQFGVPGKHPMEKLCPACYEGGDAVKDLTPTEAEEKLHGGCSCKSDDASIEEIVARVTKKVLEQYK